VLLGEVGQLRPAVIGAGLVRAKLCEILARDAGLAAADSAFMMGLLSICDALLSTPLDELVASLPLTPELAGAIVRREGDLGEVLSTAVALQHGDGRATGRQADALLAAIRWADAQLAEIPAGAQRQG
jgi:EAL and modified HD-GYP domain-containing signal transduction protein